MNGQKNMMAKRTSTCMKRYLNFLSEQKFVYPAL